MILSRTGVGRSAWRALRKTRPALLSAAARMSTWARWVSADFSRSLPLLPLCSPAVTSRKSIRDLYLTGGSVLVVGLPPRARAMMVSADCLARLSQRGSRGVTGDGRTEICHWGYRRWIRTASAHAIMRKRGTAMSDPEVTYGAGTITVPRQEGMLVEEPEAGPAPERGDLTDELIATDWWSDQMLSDVGIPVRDVEFVTVGGGVGSFVTVDYLRICGVPPDRIRVPASSTTRGRPMSVCMGWRSHGSASVRTRHPGPTASGASPRTPSRRHSAAKSLRGSSCPFSRS